jgi:tetratricopeptide (TPR) repeat protein
VLTMAVVLAVLADPGEASSSGDKDQAVAAMVEGNAAYRARRLEEAIRCYNEAYRLYRSPKLLYHLGQAYQADGQKRRAAESFRQFLEQATTDGDEDMDRRLTRASEWLASLEANPEVLAASAQAPPPPPPLRLSLPRLDASPPTPGTAPGVAITTSPVPRDSGQSRRLVWWAVALGAAVAATAAVILVSSGNQGVSCPGEADLGCI